MGIETSGIGRLNRGQRECLRLVLMHKTSKEIAQQLGISPHTVDQRIRYAIRTLGVRTRGEAALQLLSDEMPAGQHQGAEADTQAAPSPWGSQGVSMAPIYQRHVHQAPHLSANCASEPLVGSQVFGGQEAAHRVSEPAAPPYGGAGERSGLLLSRFDEDEVPLGYPRGGEANRGGLLWKQNPRWVEKLLLVILVALMSIMAAGSLMAGLSALSDALR